MFLWLVSRTILLNIPSLVILHILACGMGLVVLAYYSYIECDPVASHQVQNANHVSVKRVYKIPRIGSINRLTLHVNLFIDLMLVDWRWAKKYKLLSCLLKKMEKNTILNFSFKILIII